ncbi:MAG TPA: hypothetical protein VJ997_03380 [Longimicrobiales bacterium]|nr:hypothetical protein [Longimicrobiales bacterium]
MGKEVREVWRELRRRRVVSTAAGYAAAAFVLLQLGEIIFPAFGLGPGALRGLLALILAGFPVVLALSWVFDITRSGVQRTAPAHGEGAPSVGAPRSLDAPRSLVVFLVLAAGAALGWVGWWSVRVAEQEPPTSERPPSIAVLPFTDLSEAGDQAYLGDGLAEEILNVLAGVNGLQVAARTSSFAFRDRVQDVRDIGRELNVAAILEGSLRRTGDHVRVTAQLIDASTGFHIWSENFDRTVDDLFAVQDEIAGSIVRQLLGRLELSGRTARREISPEAQDLYWRARAQWSRRDAAGIPGAITLFRQAITLDPGYAAAYAGLADSYALMPLLVPSSSPGDALAQAEEWAHKSIALDSTLADPWASLGLVRAMRQDRVGALAAFGKAVELNPSYAPALHWRGNVLADMGQLPAALRDAARAAVLDPLSAPVAADHAAILLWSGDTDAARAEVERALSLDFRLQPALFLSAVVALEQGREVPLRMSLTQWASMSGLPTQVVPALAGAMLSFQRTGDPGEVPPQLRGVTPAQGAISSGGLASLFALMGDRDDMLLWLRRSVDDGSWATQYLGVNRVFEPFRADPEFRSILAELG